MTPNDGVILRLCPRPGRKPCSLSGRLRSSGVVRGVSLPSFQACLGLEISGVERQIYCTRPQLPVSLGELRIHNLGVAGSTIDLLLLKQRHNVEATVVRRGGDIQVMVIK
jgi:hypothetical protein